MNYIVFLPSVFPSRNSSKDYKGNIPLCVRVKVEYF